MKDGKVEVVSRRDKSMRLVAPEEAVAAVGALRQELADSPSLSPGRVSGLPAEASAKAG